MQFIIFSFLSIYLSEPRFQNTVPNIKAMNVVNISLTAVYFGFRQYDKCCFQRQAMNWVKNDWEYWVGKCKSFEPGAGVLSSLINVLFVLNVIKIVVSAKIQLRLQNFEKFIWVSALTTIGFFRLQQDTVIVSRNVLWESCYTCRKMIWQPN